MSMNCFHDWQTTESFCCPVFTERTGVGGPWRWAMQVPVGAPARPKLPEVASNSETSRIMPQRACICDRQIQVSPPRLAGRPIQLQDIVNEQLPFWPAGFRCWKHLQSETARLLLGLVWGIHTTGV